MECVIQLKNIEPNQIFKANFVLWIGLYIYQIWLYLLQIYFHHNIKPYNPFIVDFKHIDKVLLQNQRYLKLNISGNSNKEYLEALVKKYDSLLSPYQYLAKLHFQKITSYFNLYFYFNLFFS